MKMIKWPLTLLTLVLFLTGMVRAQQNQREPEAMAALDKMGTYLRTLKSFQVDAVTSTEEVLEDGQKVQFDGVTNVLARMPDRLRISVASDRHDRLLIYDGKQLTLLARRVNYYATVPAPATIAQLAEVIDQKYDLSLPLEDLFRWGSEPSQNENIKSAMFIGPSQVGGVTCGHYAFRQDGLDWQLWVQAGDHPLPRKVVVTTLTDEARPQFVATYTWNLAPSYDDAAFTFVPPKDAGKVQLSEVKKDR